MAKRTLLDIVQIILGDMSAGRVNSISDTEEALQVADVVRRTYFDLIADIDLPSRKNVIKLTALADTDKPTHFKIPDEVYEIQSVSYDSRLDSGDTQIRYVPLNYLTPEEFFERNSMYNSTDNYVQTVEVNDGVKVLIRNDQNPAYWTSFDNEYLVLDAYDSAIESTVQQSKVACFGITGASWSHIDDFVPNLPEHMFPLLISTSENRCFEFLKQTMSLNVDKQERRSRRRVNVNKNRVDRTIPAPHFGR
jgi:hypothetical protein